MSIRRRTILGSMLALPAVGALAACGSDSAGSADVVSVNYGYIPDFNGTSLLAIANDQDLWAKHGVEATLLSFTNGPLQIQAIGTGDLDFGYIGPGAMWLPASGRASVVTVNGVGQADRVIAQPGINTMEDLRGKKVAVPEGTSGDMILTLALEAAGMTTDDIERVVMDAATVVPAFASNQVDAAGIWYPLISTIKEEVPDLVEVANIADFSDRLQTANVMVTGPDFAEENEETTLRVIRVLRDAMDFRADNLDETIELVAAMNQLEVDDVAADASNGKYFKAAELDALVEDGSIETWFTAMNDFFEANDRIEGDTVPASEYYLGDLWVEAGK